jgi:Nif-specific regulatory protein
MADDSPDVVRLRREHGLFSRLLTLGRQQEPEPFMREALALIVEVTEAQQGYIELHDDQHRDTPSWSLAHGFTSEQVETVRGAISRGIIGEAIARGKTIVTQSALLDDRFRGLSSVQVGRIEAVLCVPIGADAPRGVVYLQKPAQGSGFSDADRAHAETFAWHLETLTDRVLARHLESRGTDPTAAARTSLRASEVVGRSAPLAAVLQQAALVAPLDVHVLLTGETGTGKSQLARVIHDNGPRARGPFVTLNCAVLPDTLVESELFGALPGAHSTAVRKIDGKVTSAEGGTLFLDEIGEMSLGAQAKLLHLLQAKEYHPLGGTKPVRADVRVIAATNLDLKDAVREHRFREDLFYRLQVLPIRVPSLAERREDIASLATLFRTQACSRHGLPRLEFSPNALHALESAEWPGNVRQLENTVEAAVIRAAGTGARQVEPSHLFPESVPMPDSEGAATFQEATRQFQARLVQSTLEANNWNVVETARRLDITRSHVYNLIRAFGLKRTARG